MLQNPEEPANAVEEPPVDAGQESPLPADPALQMNGFMAVKLTVDGGNRTVWQDIRSGIVQGFVDRYGRPIVPEGSFEARVITGQLVDSPGTKGDEA